MEQINTFVFYLLGQWLDSCFLTVSTKQPISANVGAFRGCVQLLDLLLNNARGNLALDVSRVAGTDVRDTLNLILEGQVGSPVDDELSDVLGHRFMLAMGNFDNALGLELARAPIFAVKQKGVYSTLTLISNASSVFEGFVHRLPSEALHDTDQAGRCLAFAFVDSLGVSHRASY